MVISLLLASRIRSLVAVRRHRSRSSAIGSPRVLALGILAAVGASCSLQHLDRAAGAGGAGGAARALLRPSLLGRLVRNRRWLGATALGLVGWPLEIGGAAAGAADRGAAVSWPAADPLLWLGADEAGGDARPARVRRRSRRSSPASPASPGRRPSGPPTMPIPRAIALALALVAIPIAWPPMLLQARVAPALASSPCSAPAAAMPGRRSPASCSPTSSRRGRCWSPSPGWPPLAASEGLALLSEMSALQRRPATHVAPVMFAVQVLVPVLLAPLIFGESWADDPARRRRPRSPSIAIAVAGTVLAGRLAAVGAVIERAAHADD